IPSCTWSGSAVGSKCSATSSCKVVIPANPSGSRGRASTRPDSSSISTSWWASAQSSPTNSTAPPRSHIDQQGSNRGEDLLQPNGSVLNRHDIPPALPAPSPTAGARSSHRPHDRPGKIRVLTGSGLGQQNVLTRSCCSPIRPNGSGRYWI